MFGNEGLKEAWGGAPRRISAVHGVSVSGVDNDQARANGALKISNVKDRTFLLVYWVVIPRPDMPQCFIKRRRRVPIAEFRKVPGPTAGSGSFHLP